MIAVRTHIKCVSNPSQISANPSKGEVNAYFDVQGQMRGEVIPCGEG